MKMRVMGTLLIMGCPGGPSPQDVQVEEAYVDAMDSCSVNGRDAFDICAKDPGYPEQLIGELTAEGLETERGTVIPLTVTLPNEGESAGGLTIDGDTLESVQISLTGTCDTPHTFTVTNTLSDVVVALGGTGPEADVSGWRVAMNTADTHCPELACGDGLGCRSVPATFTRATQTVSLFGKTRGDLLGYQIANFESTVIDQNGTQTPVLRWAAVSPAP